MEDVIAGIIIGVLGSLAMAMFVDWGKHYATGSLPHTPPDNTRCALADADINSQGRTFVLQCGDKAYRIKIEEVGVRSL